jgi:hypothetical protein
MRANHGNVGLRGHDNGWHLGIVKPGRIKFLKNPGNHPTFGCHVTLSFVNTLEKVIEDETGERPRFLADVELEVDWSHARKPWPRQSGE